jgi:glycerol-3-phosphate acyltransferase PlsY
LLAVSWALFAFLLGAVPTAQVVARYVADVDLHEHGSGNIGATNVARVVGRKAAAATLLADGLKGTLPVLGVWWHTGSLHWAWFCGILAVLGHCYTPYLRWRGGKGVATSFGVLVVAAPWSALGGLVAWGAIVAATRRSSLGALVALPTVVGVTWWTFPEHYGWALVLALVVLVRHASNIRRLWSGAELGFTGPTAAEP